MRIIRACRDRGLSTVAVYSDADRAARHVRMADEACWIGPAPAADSYLHIDHIITAARMSGADAVHPGYGFLSENAAFARACRDAGLLFIGPSPEAIALMGSKTLARQVARRSGVPVVPGTDGPLPDDASDADLQSIAEAIGYPLLVKAVAGGGGKGMRLVREPAELVRAIRTARSEAVGAFGDPAVYLERHLDRPRHIEVQVLADAHGTVLPFVERECSIQRRHQKLLEETPSPIVTPSLRGRLTAAAAAVTRAAAYTSAGTIEFLLDAQGDFYFLEMNTRLQVEHPITEEVTGVDLVQWQLRIAEGEPLTLDPVRLLEPEGHAIECRIYAEDADAGFMPSPGRILALTTPGGPGIRDDGAVEAGGEVPIFYDPLVSKLVARGVDRAHAIARMQRALAEYAVIGIRTTVPFFAWLLRQPDFLSGAVHTTFLDEVLQQRPDETFVDADLSHEEVAAIAAVLTNQAGGGLEAMRAGTTGAMPPSWNDGADGSASRAPSGHERSWLRTARQEALRH